MLPNIATGTRCPAWAMMYPLIVRVVVMHTSYFLVAGGDDGLRRLRLLQTPNAVPQSWHQLVVYQVVRRAAVHNDIEG